MRAAQRQGEVSEGHRNEEPPGGWNYRGLNLARLAMAESGSRYRDYISIGIIAGARALGSQIGSTMNTATTTMKTA